MELLVQVLLLIVGFVMLVKGADWFVDGAAGLADRFGIPQLVIGLTIVAMGTSAPEAAVSITAALKGLDLETLSLEEIVRQALKNMIH